MLDFRHLPKSLRPSKDRLKALEAEARRHSAQFSPELVAAVMAGSQLPPQSQRPIPPSQQFDPIAQIFANQQQQGTQ